MSGLSTILFSLLRFICIHCLNDHLPHCLYCPFILNSEHSIPHLRVAHTLFFFLFWWTYYAKKRSLEGWWSIIKDLVLYIWRHLSNIKWWNICRFVLYYPAHVCNHELPPFPLLFFFSPPTLFFFPILLWWTSYAKKWSLKEWRIIKGLVLTSGIGCLTLSDERYANLCCILLNGFGILIYKIN